MKPLRITAAALAALTVAIAAAPGAAAQQTRRLAAGKDTEYGLVYTLPLTTVEITVAAQKRVERPGEFALWSKRYLGLDPILEPSESWSLLGAEMRQGARADASERWRVQFKSGSAVEMTLSPEGFPLGVNAGDDDLESAGTAPWPTLVPVVAAPTVLESAAAREAVTEDMLRSPSSAKRAELAAARIYEIRQTRSDILSGQADAMPADGAGMQLVLDNLRLQEEALTAMFTGTVQTSVDTVTLSALPPAADDAATAPAAVVARLSATDGLVGPGDLSGAPITLRFGDISLAELPVNEKGLEKAFPKDGLAYRIPGRATATLHYDGATVARLADIDVAQYGVVFGADPALFSDRKAPSQLIFEPLTGAVRRLGPAPAAVQ